MNAQKKYEKPEMTVLSLIDTDIVTLSVGGRDDEGELIPVNNPVGLF